MQDVLIALIIGGTVAFSMWAAYRHPKRERSNEPGGDVQGEVTALRQELDGVHREVAELAERVDFTERLLAKQRDAQRLAPPQG